MNESNNRKTGIPLKAEPSVAWILRESTGEQLDFLNRIAKSGEFKVFVNLIAKFKHYNVYTVFEYKAVDHQDLADYRSYRKGSVDSLDALLKAAKLSGEEIERRKNK
jgi:hypothetical protein